MINSFLIFAAAGIGFGGSPWAAFAICASLIIVLGLPQQHDLLKRFAGQPKTDVYFVILFEVGLAVAGALASAWVGYGLRLLLRR